MTEEIQPAAPAAEPSAPAAAPAPAAPPAPAKPEVGFSQHEALPGVLADSKPRDNKGRFAPASAAPLATAPTGSPVGSDPAASGVATMSDSTPAAPAQPSATASPAPAPTAFKVGRFEFKSPEHAEQVHSTLQGKYRSLEQQNADLRLKLLEAQRQPAPTPPSGPQPGAPAPEPEPAGIDWEVFDHLARHNGPAVAQRWLAGEQEKLITARSEALFKKALGGVEEKFAPIVEIQQTLQRAAVMDQTINSLRAYKYGDGTPAYPEFDNPAALREIRHLWIEMKMPEEMLSTMNGLHAAVEVYRGALMRRAGATSPRPTAAQVVLPPVASPVAGVSGDRPAAAPGPQRQKTTAERILAANLTFDDQLGFGR